MITPINSLKPLEKVFLYHLKNLSKMILKEGIVHTPIIADKKHGIVLDGSHRYIFFLMNGFVVGGEMVMMMVVTDATKTDGLPPHARNALVASLESSADQRLAWRMRSEGTQLAYTSVRASTAA